MKVKEDDPVDEHKISLTGTLNMRDLGGYPTTDGGMTKRGAFIRSDSLHNLTEEDKDTLLSLGVTMQIDMRSCRETSGKPSRLQGIDRVAYYPISFLDNIQSSGFKNMPESLTELYCELLDQYREKYACLFRTVLSGDGLCIFNCTAGKDRTGVVAMLLLSLAGVDREAILDDYAVSASNMAAAFELQKRQLMQDGSRLPDYIFISDPIDMKQTIDFLNEKYSGAWGYLQCCGLTDTEIGHLRNRLRS